MANTQGVTVEVRLYALLAELAGVRQITVSVAYDATVARVVQRIGELYPELREHLPHCRTALNQEYAEPGAPVSNGSVVALIPPVSGGSASGEDSEEGDAGFSPVRVTSEELDPRALERYVVNNTMGAVVTFSGVVREFTGDHQTRFLQYEAYTAMAKKVLVDLIAETESRWPGVRLAIWHRVGHQDIGETSVVIAAAAPHRVAAFEACRYAIDELKVRVPIWKKEVYADGSHWVGDNSRGG